MEDLYHLMSGEKPIRLLELHPHMDNQRFSCSLIHTHLKDVQGQYDAVSYTWGGALPEKEILMNRLRMHVRPSVYEILHRFQGETQTRLLWLDQLCINQNDLKERAEQVSIMPEIYKGAHEVLIWLGEEDGTSARAMKYISVIDPEGCLEESYAFQRHGISSDGWADKSTIFDTLKPNADNRVFIEALVALLSRPWFSRVWIQQEAAVHPATIVFCGQSSVHWDQLFALGWLLTPRGSSSWPAWVLDLYPNLEPKLRAMLCLQFSRRSIHRPSESVTGEVRSLPVLVESTWMCLATDPRDKIFALRNLITDAKSADWAPKVDYRVCWEDVYTDMAMRVLKQKKIDILRCAGRVKQQHDSRLPSWAPDWRIWPSYSYTYHDFWRAGSSGEAVCKFGSVPKSAQRLIRKNWLCGQSSPKPKLASRTVLSLTCIMQDSIAFLSGVAESMFHYEGFFKRGNVADSSQRLLDLDQSCQDFLQANLLPNYLTGESIADTYRATLIANTTHTTELATPDYYNSYLEWRSWLASGANPSEEPIYETAIEDSNTFWMEQFCVTSHKYICLVPRMADKNDFVAILKGLGLPVILRPQGEYYELIGNCYVHGMMENQAFCLIDEFGLQYQAPDSGGTSRFMPNSSRALNIIPSQKLQVAGSENEDYSSVITTLGLRQIDLI